MEIFLKSTMRYWKGLNFFGELSSVNGHQNNYIYNKNGVNSSRYRKSTAVRLGPPCSGTLELLAFDDYL